MLNSVLIIDNHKSEIEKLVTELNNNAISTDFRETVLEEGVMVNPYTQLVVLDLYLSKSENSYEEAIDSVEFLSSEITNPFYILVWTKNKDNFNEFKDKVNKLYLNLENPPLDINMIDEIKSLNELSSSDIKNVINSINAYMIDLKSKYPNIQSFRELTNLFRKESSSIWQIFLKTSSGLERNAESLDSQIGSVMDSLDEAQGFDKSGKGMLSLQSKIIEDSLTQSPLVYTAKDKLKEDIKDSLNEYIYLHKLKNEDGTASVHDKPGVIIKSEINSNLQIFSEDKMKENNIIAVENFSECTINDLEENKIGSFSFRKGSLIVTPFCDYSNKKHYHHLVLPIIEIKISSEFSKRKLKAVLDSIKQNYNMMKIKKDLYICYEIRQVYSKNKELELKIKDVFSYYLSKEVVNNIQSEIGASISRVGISSI